MGLTTWWIVRIGGGRYAGRYMTTDDALARAQDLVKNGIEGKPCLPVEILEENYAPPTRTVVWSSDG